MKKQLFSIILIILLILSLLLTGCNSDNDSDNKDNEKDTDKKICAIEDCDEYAKDGDYCKDHAQTKPTEESYDINSDTDKQYSLKNETDDEGRVIYHPIISPNGGVVSYTEYTYDEKDRIVTATDYNGNGDFTSKQMYIYDDTDYGDNIERIKEQRTLDENNTVIKNTVREYNSRGSEIKISNWDMNTLKDYTEYEYNSDGQMIKASCYTGNGQLSSYIVYTYDNNGNEIATKYDSNGNQI